MTMNQAELTAVIRALGRLNTACELTIYTESGYVAAGYQRGWIEQWKQNEWKTAKGKDVANADEWRQLDELLRGNEYSFKVNDKHQYSGWLRTETEKEAKENELCLKNLENSIP